MCFGWARPQGLLRADSSVITTVASSAFPISNSFYTRSNCVLLISGPSEQTRKKLGWQPTGHSVRTALRGIVRSMDLTAKTFAFGQHFLSYNGPSDTACIVADVQMPGMVFRRTTASRQQRSFENR